VLVHNLCAGLLAALDFTRLRTVDVVRGDPVGIISSSGGDGGARALLDRWGLRTLSAASGTLLTSLATLTLLREVGSDPDSVEEVDGTTEAGQEEKVQENAVYGQSIFSSARIMQSSNWNSKGVLHLGVEDASLGLHNAHGAIEGLNGEKLALTVRQNGGNVQTKILGVHFGGEAIRDSLLLASGNLNTIAGGSQVANNLALLLQVPKATSKEVDSDWVRLVVDDRNQSLSWTTIDELNAKDLGGRERSLSLDSKVGNLSLRDSLSILIEEKISIQSVN